MIPNALIDFGEDDLPVSPHISPHLPISPKALIDFGEDADDVTTDALLVARGNMRALGEALRAQLADGRRGG